MVKKFLKENAVEIFLICAVIVITSVTVFKCVRTQKSTALLPQNKSGFIFTPSYSIMPGSWGIDSTLSKMRDLSPSANYWVADKNPNIVLSVEVTENSKDLFFYKDRLLMKDGYELPEDIGAEDVSEIVLAECDYTYSLEQTDENQLYWNPIKCVHLNLTEQETLRLAELLQYSSSSQDKYGYADTELNYTEEFPENGEPYFWHFRLYVKNIDGLYYDHDASLYRTTDNRYFISFSRYYNSKNVFLPDELNQKFQSAFEKNEFRVSTEKF